jgi:magnesium transporter
MIRALYRAPSGGLPTDATPIRFQALLDDANGLLWVDFQGEPNETSEPILRDTFHFHPLAIDDALQESHIPRVDDWEWYLYLVLHAVVYEQRDGGTIDTLELDIFLGPNYMVTHHDLPIQAVDAVWQRCQRDERLMKNGGDHLLYELADHLVARYMPVIDTLDQAIDEIEVELFDTPRADTLERLFALKQAVVYLRRIIAPQREALNRLARDDYAVISANRRVYFRDIYDHLVRLHDTAEGLRDVVSSAVDTYLSVVNNRLSDVMKTLTIITTLFMPISFLAGFFGMNFFSPSDASVSSWTGRSMLIAALVLMAICPIAMYWLLRRRQWM